MDTQSRSTPIRSANSSNRARRASGVVPGTPDKCMWASQIIIAPLIIGPEWTQIGARRQERIAAVSRSKTGVRESPPGTLTPPALIHSPHVAQTESSADLAHSGSVERDSVEDGFPTARGFRQAR